MSPERRTYGVRCPTCHSLPCQCASPKERPRTWPLRESCVCGGPDIVTAGRTAGDIMAAVQRHQIEPKHIAWDEANGIPLSGPQLDARALDGELIGVGLR